MNVGVAMIWDQEYRINVAAVDEDHQHLFALHDRLQSAVEAGRGASIIEEILGELTQYTQHHFDREEALMLCHRYPEHDDHKRMHQAFITRLDEIHHRTPTGEDPIAVLTSFVKNWLTGHILIVDRRLGDYLRSTIDIRDG